MKKLLTLFLAAMMLATCMFALPAQAAEEANVVNLIPDLDEAALGENGLPDGWALDGLGAQSQNTYAVSDVTVEDAAQGITAKKKIVVNKTDSTENLYLSPIPVSLRDKIVPGTEYTLSVKYKSSVTNWTPTYGFSANASTFDYTDSYKEGDNTIYPYFKEGWAGKATEWTEWTTNFTFPENKFFMLFSIRMANGKTGTFEFAEISLLGQKAKESVNIAPDFSNVDANGVPAGWTTAGANTTGADSSVITSVQNNGPGGAPALVLESKNSSGTAVSGLSIGIAFGLDCRQRMVPGETYRVSFQYMRNGGSHSVGLISSNGINTLPAEGTLDADGVPMNPATADQGRRWCDGTANSWVSVAFVVTASRHAQYHWLQFKSGNRGASVFKIANVKVEGIRRPGSEPLYGSEILTNGGFTNGSAGWELSDDSVLKTEGTNTVAALPNVGDYAEITFPVGTSKVYEVQADVKSSVSGSLKASVRTAPESVTNIEKGKPFYERVVDYSYAFESSGSEWKKIKFSIYPMSTSKEVTISFENAVADAVLMLDNVSVKPTKELISNGDFEGLAFVSKNASPDSAGKPVEDGIPGWGTAVENENSQIKFGTTYGQTGTGAMLAMTVTPSNGGIEPFLSQKIPMESGKTYKVSYSLKASHTNCPQAGWMTNTYGGVSYMDDGAWHSLTANTWEGITKYITMPTVNDEGKTWNSKDTAWIFRWAGRFQTGSYYVDNVSVQEVANGVNYYNVNGEKYNSLSEAKGKTIYSYFASAALPQDTEISLISALYDVSSGTPMLVDATVSKGKNSMNAPIFGTIDIPDYEGTYKLSVFCLDSITGLKALEAKYDFE